MSCDGLVTCPGCIPASHLMTPAPFVTAIGNKRLLVWVRLRIASCCGQNVFEVPSCNYRTRSQSVNLCCTLNNAYFHVIYLSDRHQLVYICGKCGRPICKYSFQTI